MKFTLLCVMFVALAAIVFAAPDGYSTKYDNIDLKEILQTERLLNNYIACIDGTGKCTPEGEELKKNMVDAIQTCCEKCSEKQKKGAEEVLNHLKEHKAEKLEEFKAKYDPTGEHEKECKKKYGY